VPTVGTGGEEATRATGRAVGPDGRQRRARHPLGRRVWGQRPGQPLAARPL